MPSCGEESSISHVLDRAEAVGGVLENLAGGRWSPPGLPTVYLAGSRSLAALEIVVHAPREVLSLEWRIFEVEVPDDAIEEPERLPKDWAALSSSPAARIARICFWV